MQTAHRVHLEAHADSLLALISTVISPALHTANLTRHRPYFERVSHNPAVRKVVLADTEQRIVFSTSPEDVGTPLPALHATDTSFWRTHTLHHATGSLGTVQEHSDRHMGLHCTTTFPPIYRQWPYQAGLEQVLLHLLANARQALDSHDRPRKPITVTASAAHAHVLIHIEDNGPGIAPEMRVHLFDPFFTTKEPGEGSGLGLSIVYGLVTECGGTVTVSAGENGGAIFVLHLPVGV